MKRALCGKKLKQLSLYIINDEEVDLTFIYYIFPFKALSISRYLPLGAFKSFSMHVKLDRFFQKCKVYFRTWETRKHNDFQFTKQSKVLMSS